MAYCEDNMKKILEIVEIIIKLFIIVFGIVIIYRVVLKILGGSWQTENIIIALLIANITLTFALAINQAKMGAEVGHFKNQFKCLAKDFKYHLSNKI